MNKSLIILLTVLAIGGFVWAMNERSKKLLLQEKLDKKDDDYLKLMSGYLKNKKEIPKEIKDQLLNLRKEYAGINDKVALKLQTVIELIQDDKEEIAIEKLITIVENLLKEKYKKEFKDKKIPNLYGLLKKAKEWKWITDYQFNFSLFVKEQRNEEAHELTANFSKNEKYIAFLTGIEIIYQLAGFKTIS